MCAPVADPTEAVAALQQNNTQCSGQMVQQSAAWR